MITADWWMWVYLALAIASAACALTSRSFALTYADATMLVSWAVSNGVPRASFTHVVPEVDAILAVGVCYVGRWKRSPALAIVFGLFVAEMVVHGVSILVNATHNPWYFATLNAVFTLACITTGAASVAQARSAPRTAWRRPGFVDLARIGREVGSRLADVAAGRKEAS